MTTTLLSNGTKCPKCGQYPAALAERLDTLKFIKEKLVASKSGSLILFDDGAINIVELLLEKAYPTTEAPYELLFGIPVVTAYFPWGEVSYHAYRRHSEFKQSLRIHQNFIVPEDCTFLLPE